MKIQKFVVNVPDSALQDLNYRLKNTRLPDAGPKSHGSSSWGAGTPLQFAQKLLTYWREEYDWRKYETVLNSFNHYIAELDPKLDSLKLHFIHEKATKTSVKSRFPILILHGWPGSVWEFNKIIPILTNAGFDVVAPSLPGYGFSEPPKTPGWNTLRIAEAVNSLMLGLGYTEYYAQGGDWGSMVCKQLGSKFTDNCKALHVNMLAARPPNGMRMSQAVKTLNETDLKKVERLSTMRRYEFAYQEIQGTKPQTLGYSLADSPIGLATWIVEKFSTWGDNRPDRDPLRAFSMDDLLTNVSIYWFNNVGPSSIRLYYESRNSPGGGLLAGGDDSSNVVIPTGIAEFPNEIFVPPESWVRARYDVRKW
eukprot:CAMPEP_0184014532 /NCGR_PEP_ID=MMETSP0954-20121128/5727_1 /TAXON_ID=627963 /ORGANISM="Aplanochytrium sp, Strain PBS07" /LENGTH=364 /DNA_ID=CAMNT_0026295055 /DNA_START=120 /DNA_END=1211 /DNA_ORIENTATION=+